MKRAQVSIEAIAAIGLLFLVLLILVGIVVEKRADTFKTNRLIEARKECLKLSNLITEAFIHGDGIVITEKINFNASIMPRARLISVQNKEEVFCTIPVINVTQTDLVNGSISIKNVNKTVIVENV